MRAKYDIGAAAGTIGHGAPANTTQAVKPVRGDAEDAVRVLLRGAGDDPERSGLKDTPARVVRAFEEFFKGYGQDPAAILRTTFDETDGYDEMVLLKDIEFSSHCEHHLAPIVGRAHVAYLPQRRVVVISKLARLVESYARRLQIQERMTVQIADAIQDPAGVLLADRPARRPGAGGLSRRLRRGAAPPPPAPPAWPRRCGGGRTARP